MCGVSVCINFLSYSERQAGLEFSFEPASAFAESIAHSLPRAITALNRRPKRGVEDRHTVVEQAWVDERTEVRLGEARLELGFDHDTWGIAKRQ